MKYKTNINGRKRNVYTGPKGGKYYMKGGKKMYVNRVMKGGAKYYLEEGKTFINGGNEISSFNDFLMYCRLKDYLQENSSRSLDLIQELRKITYTKKPEDAHKLFDEITAICNITFNKEFHAYRLIKFAKKVVIVCEEEEHNIVQHTTKNSAGRNGAFSYNCSICGKEFNKDNYKSVVQKNKNSCEHNFSDGISQNHLLSENEPPITSYKCNKCNSYFENTSKEYQNYINALR